jgi:hypothetical protein
VVFAKHATGSLWYDTDLQFVRSDHEAVRCSSEFFARVVATGRPVYALNDYWETREIDAHGRGTGRPDLPGEWERLATIWQGDVVAWQRHSPATAAGKGSNRESPHAR